MFMAKLERIYTVPLGDAYDAIRNKRVPRAVKLLRAFIARHMKADGERILLSGALNAHLWSHSIQKPPRRVKVRLVKEESVIRAYLADEKAEEPKEKAGKKEKEAPKKEEAKPAEKKPEEKKEHPAGHEHKAPEKKAEGKREEPPKNKEPHPAAKHEHAKAEPRK